MTGHTDAVANDRLARVALSHLVEPGDPRVMRALIELGPQGLLQELRDHVARQGVAAEASTRFADLDPVAALAEAESQGVRFVVPGDIEWPHGFDDLAVRDPVSGKGGAPVGVWVRGTGRLNELLPGSIAIVGARSATTYGDSVARSIAHEVSVAERVVVSGAAYGIDRSAHAGALSSQLPTIAVLACGADRHYPAAHRDLIDVIADTGGAVVSEVPPGWSPTKLRFLARNRLIAAMTGGAVVVEAAHRSGALNTANWSARLGRVLMGVPGPVTSAQSEGVHELIRSGQAALVTSGADVLELLAPVGESARPRPRGAERPEDALSGAERRVLDALPVVDGATVESIARTAGVGPSSVSAQLVRLGEAGLAETDGRVWRLRRAFPDESRSVPTLES